MISSYLQLIERRYKDKLDEDADDFINFAVDGANRLQSLIIGLLEYSRIRTHGRSFQKTDVNDILARVIKDLDLLIRETEADVEYGDMPVIYADDRQISRLFQNLIQNSIKFRREGIKPHIVITSEKAGMEYTFSVRDNGIGIEPEYYEKIFVIFQRLHSREEYPGTGIGLSICRRIVERHGGMIRVESVIGEGTTFYFTIPVKDGNKNQTQFN
jgi:light-regulated signal transduction histidine kinase (bacteriophytochrome)